MFVNHINLDTIWTKRNNIHSERICLHLQSSCIFSTFPLKIDRFSSLLIFVIAFDRNFIFVFGSFKKNNNPTREKENWKENWNHLTSDNILCGIELASLPSIHFELMFMFWFRSKHCYDLWFCRKMNEFTKESISAWNLRWSFVFPLCTHSTNQSNILISFHFSDNHIHRDEWIWTKWELKSVDLFGSRKCRRQT